MLARSRLKLHPKPTRSCLIACFGIPCRNTIFHTYGGAYCRRASHATSTMTASKIDGTAIANKIKSRISDDIQKKQSSNPAFKPSLVIIQGLGIDEKFYFCWLSICQSGRTSGLMLVAINLQRSIKVNELLQRHISA